MWCDAVDVMHAMRCDRCDAMLCYGSIRNGCYVIRWMWCDRCDATDVIDAMLCYGSITSHSSHRNACIHRIHSMVSHHITFITSHPYHHITFIAVIITPLTLLVNLLICHVHFYKLFCIFYVIWRKGIIILRFWL